MSIEKGKLFVVEGGVGCGKSTQLNLLAKELGNGWVFHREPGGTIFGELVRRAVQSGMDGGEEVYPVSRNASLFAYSAARANLITTKVIPELTKGKNVGLDRYWYSTFAYQGAEGVSKIFVWMLSCIATKGLKPDLVLHYDLLPEIGIARKKNQYLSDIDRYDFKPPEFHRVVRENYHRLKRLYPKTWNVIDASKSIEEVKGTSLDILRKYGIVV